MRPLNFTGYLAIILIFCLHIDCKAQETLLEKVKQFLPETAIASNAFAYAGDLSRDVLKMLYYDSK